MKRSIAVVAAAALLATLGAVTSPAGAEEWWDDRGGDADLPPTVLWDGDAGVSNIKDQAIVRMSEYGFVYIAGQQDSNLRVHYNESRHRLVYRDWGTQGVKRLHRKCRQRNVRRGIAIACRVPWWIRDSMFVQVWPRLGDDRIDATLMPARHRLWVLADAGDDIVLTAGGDDFVNGAMGRDHVESGDGADWLRGGKYADTMDGGAGNDKLVGGNGPDSLSGGDGDDKLYGGRGADTLDGGAGENRVVQRTGGRSRSDDL